MKEDLFPVLEQVTECLDRIHGIRHRPMIGGAFGSNQYCLASTTYVERGLDQVWYFVREWNSGAVICYGDSKSKAIEAARTILSACNPLDLAQYVARVQARRDAEKAEMAKREREAEAEYEEIRKGSAKVRSIPRRRKQIFEADGGKCHYCSTPLTLDGKWHIEHKMPKALGGGNEPGNLVASCVSCNHKKRDTTDVEFKAKLAKESA